MAQAQAQNNDWTIVKALMGGLSDVVRRKAEIAQMGKEVALDRYKRGIDVNPAAAAESMVHNNAPVDLAIRPGDPQALLDAYVKNSERYEKGIRSVADAINPGEYNIPEGGAERVAHDLLRNAPYTLTSMGVSVPVSYAAGLAGGVYGGPAGALAAQQATSGILSFLLAHSEARDESVDVYNELRQKGYAPHEAKELADRDYAANVGILTLSNYLQQYMTAGPGINGIRNALGIGGRHAAKTSPSLATSAAKALGIGGRHAAGAAGRTAGAASGAAVRGMPKWLSRLLGAAAVDVPSEAAEEASQNIAASLSKGEPINWEQTRYEALLGGLSGGVFAGGGSAIRSGMDAVTGANEAGNRPIPVVSDMKSGEYLVNTDKGDLRIKLDREDKSVLITRDGDGRIYRYDLGNNNDQYAQDRAIVDILRDRFEAFEMDGINGMTRIDKQGGKAQTPAKTEPVKETEEAQEETRAAGNPDVTPSSIATDVLYGYRRLAAIPEAQRTPEQQEVMNNLAPAAEAFVEGDFARGLSLVPDDIPFDSGEGTVGMTAAQVLDRDYPGYRKEKKQGAKQTEPQQKEQTPPAAKEEPEQQQEEKPAAKVTETEESPAAAPVAQPQEQQKPVAAVQEQQAEEEAVRAEEQQTETPAPATAEETSEVSQAQPELAQEEGQAAAPTAQTEEQPAQAEEAAPQAEEKPKAAEETPQEKPQPKVAEHHYYRANGESNLINNASPREKEGWLKFINDNVDDVRGRGKGKIETIPGTEYAGTNDSGVSVLVDGEDHNLRVISENGTEDEGAKVAWESPKWYEKDEDDLDAFGLYKYTQDLVDEFNKAWQGKDGDVATTDSVSVYFTNADTAVAFDRWVREREEAAAFSAEERQEQEDNGPTEEDMAAAELEQEMNNAAYESPKSRANVVRWILDNGKLDYSSIADTFGKERAEELRKRCGPGIFAPKGTGGMSLDVVAESMSSKGAYFGDDTINADEEVFNILMSETPPGTPPVAPKPKKPSPAVKNNEEQQEEKPAAPTKTEEELPTQGKEDTVAPEEEASPSAADNEKESTGNLIEGYDRSKEMSVKMPFEKYNGKRYGKPWGTRLSFDGDRANYKENGRFTGKYTGDENGGEVVIDGVHPGDIVAFGQKDYVDKRGTKNNWAVVENDGGLRKIDKTEAYDLYKRIKEAEAKAKAEQTQQAAAEQSETEEARPAQNATPETETTPSGIDGATDRRGFIKKIEAEHPEAQVVKNGKAGTPYLTYTAIDENGVIIGETADEITPAEADYFNTLRDKRIDEDNFPAPTAEEKPVDRDTVIRQNNDNVQQIAEGDVTENADGGKGKTGHTEHSESGGAGAVKTEGGTGAGVAEGVAGLGGVHGDVGDRGGDISGGQPGLGVGGSKDGNGAGMAGSVRNTEGGTGGNAGGNSRPTVGGDAEGLGLPEVNEKPEDKPSAHNTDLAATAAPHGAQSNTHPDLIGEKPTLAGENPGNFIITDEVKLGQGADGDKLNANFEALRTLKKILSENRYATKEEQVKLARYVGWGGLSNAFENKNADATGQWGDAYRDAKTLFGEIREILQKQADERGEKIEVPDLYAAARSSTQYAHYTSEEIVGAIWDAVKRLGFKRGNILEPTVGVGNFLGLQPTDLRLNSHWYADELDTVSGLIAKCLYPDAKIEVGRGFQDVAFKRGAFDLAVGNPPFSKNTIEDGRKLPDKKDIVPEMNLHSFILAKTGDHLRPGGIMGVVVTHNFLDNMNNTVKGYFGKNYKLLGAVRLPNNAFLKNAGTKVTTDILFIQKLHVGEKAEVNPAWLDTNGSITVNGVEMKVNRYFVEHPENILGTSSIGRGMYSDKEYTVISDGRDLRPAIEEALRKSLPTNVLDGATNSDLDLSAATAVASQQLAISGMQLRSDGKIYRRLDNDSSGKEVIEVVTPNTIWGSNGDDYDKVVKDLRAMKKAAKDMDALGFNAAAQLLAGKDTDFLRTVDRGGASDGEAEQPGIVMKKSKNKAEDAIKTVVKAIKSGTRKWTFDAELAAIEKALKGKALGSDNYIRLGRLLELRNMVLQLMEAERADMPEAQLNTMRAELNEKYDAFIEEFGYISSRENRRLLRADIGVEQGLEVGYDKGVSEKEAEENNIKVRPETASKNGILKHRIYLPSEEITHADSPEGGLKVSLNQRGRFDPDYVAQLTGMSKNSVIKELSTGDNPQIFYDYEAERWVEADRYFSGDIKAKIKAAEAHNDKKAVEALKKAMPAPKKKENITPSIRGKWIPETILRDFLRALGVRNASVSISQIYGTTEATGYQSENTILSARYRNEFDQSIIELFNAAANGKSIKMYLPKESRDAKPVVDEEATKKINALIVQMNKDFERWAFADDDRAKVIIDAYNDKMNTMVERKYDGVSHLGDLTGSGQNPKIDLRDTQKNAAWRMIQDQNVLLDHVVGAGKTYTIVTGIMQRKRMGLSKKPLIVVPNNLVMQWADAFNELYRQPNILALTPDDFTAENRRAFIARMATGDYDAIIIGHDSLKHIKDSEGDQLRPIKEQIDLLKKALEEADGRQTVKKIEAALERYQAKLHKLKNMADKNRDNLGFTFEDIGVDYLVVDEAHEFKNLEYTTSMEQVSGMNNPDGSAMAWDLYTKVRGVQERGGGVVFATGTPVSNSLVEMYTIMKYLAHDELVNHNLAMFDAWAAAFAEVESRMEYTPEQKVKEKNALSRLVNLNALQGIYRSFADVISQEDREISYKAEMEAKNEADGGNRSTRLPVPKIEGNGVYLNIAPPGPHTQQLSDSFVVRTGVVQKRGKAYRALDNKLYILTDARNAALDPRTIDPTLPREENGKVMRAARSIKEFYDKWDKDKGTQLVFCDNSTPSDTQVNNAKQSLKEILNALYEDKKRAAGTLAALSKRYDTFAEIYAAVKDLAKGNADAESLIKGNDKKYAHNMLKADVNFNVYDDLKQVLVEMGIPKKEIAFIHDYTDSQKRDLFEKVNNGEIRVLIGSSAKMGAGMNVQERVVALHNLDVPWRPSDWMQRLGRAMRQGNALYDRDPDNFRINVIAYATESTTDAVMWGIIQRKQESFDYVRQGKDIDTMVETSDEAEEFAQFMSITTGDQTFMRKVASEKEAREAEAKTGGTRVARSDAEEFLSTYESEKRRYEKAKEEIDNSPLRDSEEYKLYKEEFSAEQKIYNGEIEKYNNAVKKYDEALKEWEKADKKTRGKEPSAPNKPPAPHLFSESMLKRSAWARRMATLIERMNDHAIQQAAFGKSVGRDVGVGGITLHINALGFQAGGVRWSVFYKFSNGVSYEIAGTDAIKEWRRSSILENGLDLLKIREAEESISGSIGRTLDKLEQRKRVYEDLLAEPFDDSEYLIAANKANWYQYMAAIAEAKTSIARLARGVNKYIEEDVLGRPLKEYANELDAKKDAPEVVTIDGKTYLTTGVNNIMPDRLIGYEAHEVIGSISPQPTTDEDLSDEHEWIPSNSSFDISVFDNDLRVENTDNDVRVTVDLDSGLITVTEREEDSKDSVKTIDTLALSDEDKSLSIDELNSKIREFVNGVIHDKGYGEITQYAGSYGGTYENGNMSLTQEGSRRWGLQQIDGKLELGRPAILMREIGKVEWKSVLRQPDSVAEAEAKEANAATEAYRLSGAPQTAEERLNADAAAFAAQVDRYKAGNMARHEMLNVMQTPLVLQISDPRVKPLPIVMTQYAIEKMFTKHGLSPTLAKQIPKAFADPVMILNSVKYKDSLVVMLELKDAKGRTLNVPVHLSKRHNAGGALFICNDMASAFGRADIWTGAPHDMWFIEQAKNKTRLLYINKNKASRWAHETGTEVPMRELIKKLSPSVKTEADLVKAWEENKDAYSIRGAEAAPPPITAEAIAPYVPKGMTVTKMKGGQVSIEGPSGFTIVLTNQSEPITPNPEVVKRDYGRDVSPSDVVTGRTRLMGKGAFIDLVAGMSSVDDFDHEVYEVARGLCMTDEEKNIMSQAYPDKEAEAEAYKDYMNGRIAKQMKGRVARIFQRIKDFFANLRANLFGKNSEDIFRDIAEGRMFARGARTGGRRDVALAAERYRRANNALQEIADGAEESVIREARDDISMYGGSNDVALIWGNSKKGLAHIGDKRGAETIANVVRTVLEGNILKYVEAKKTLHIEWNGYEAVLSLDENGKSKTWLLTGWRQNRPDAIGEVGTQSDATHNRPTFSRSDMGAGLKIIVEQYNRLVNEGTDVTYYRMGGTVGEVVSASRAAAAEPVEYVPPVTDKTALPPASGRTIKEQSVGQKIAAEQGIEDVADTKKQRNLTLGEMWNAALDFVQYELFDTMKRIETYFGSDVYNVVRHESDSAANRARALIENGDPESGVKGLKQILEGMSPIERKEFARYIEWKNLLDVAKMTEDAEAAVAALEQEIAEDEQRMELLRKDIEESTDPEDRKALERGLKGLELHVKKLTREIAETRRAIRETRANSSSYEIGIERMDEAYPEFAEKQKEIVKFNNYILKEYRAAGIISPETYATLSVTRPNYVPALRDFSEDEEGFGGMSSFNRSRGMVNIGSPWKRMKGSSRDVLDPLVNMAKNAAQMTKMRAQQKMANAVLDKVYGEDNEELAGLIKRTYDKTSRPGHHVFYIWRGGKKVYYETPDISIYRALTMFDPSADYNPVVRLLAASANLLRRGVGMSGRYMVWNPMRDTTTAYVYGENFRPVVDTIIGMMHVARKDDVFYDYLRHGGGSGRTSLAGAELDAILKDMYRDKKRNPLQALLHALSRLNEITEHGTRVGQYIRALEAGMTAEDADILAKEVTLNFSRHGRTGRALSTAIPFFNSNMQDMYKLFNAHFGNNRKINPGLRRTVTKALLGLTLPSILLWLWNNGDDDRRKKYQEIEQWKKNNFWYIIMPGGNYAIPIPKPFAVGILYGSLPERLLDYYLGQDEKNGTRMVAELGKSFAASLLPGYAPLLISQMFEQFANYSIFYDRPIVPESEKNIAPHLQYGPYTAEWAKGLGSITGLSPRRLEHFVFGATGNLGKEISTLFDDVARSEALSKLTGGSTRAKKDWYELVPVVNNILVSTRHFKEPVRAWEAESKRLEKAYKIAQSIEDREGTAALSDRQKILLDYDGDIKNLLYINKGKNGIWQLQRDIKHIQLDKSMTSQQKRDAIDAIDKKILLLARAGLGELRKYEDAVKAIEEQMKARREETR